ncbi:MAG: hypothetical protein LQ342_004466 [Letrouitia transgressa]|nr:MAG: hypothetical protein LQ342_004466 [Letrouitia transgressa]
MDPLSVLVGVCMGSSGTLALQALAARSNHRDFILNLVRMSKKTKVTEQIGFAMIKSVIKTGRIFDALIPPPFPEPIPATRASLLPTAEPSGPVQPLPSLNPTATSTLLSAHPISLPSIVMMLFLLVLLITSLAAIFFVACSVKASKRTSQASTENTFITSLKTRIAELEIELARQTVQNVDLSRRLEEHAPGNEPALSVAQVGAISISPASEIEQQESYESLPEQSVGRQETSNPLEPSRTEEERPKDWTHPRKLRNMRRGGPNKGRHAPKKPEQDLETVVGESGEIGVEATQAEGDNEKVETELAAEQPTSQGPTGRPGHRAQYRAKKREQKAAEKAALAGSSSNDHHS